MSVAVPTRAKRLGRLERPALTGVLVRDYASPPTAMGAVELASVERDRCDHGDAGNDEALYFTPDGKGVVMASQRGAKPIAQLVSV